MVYNKGSETIVVMQPFFHMAGKIMALSCGLYSGATLVICQQFDYAHYLKLNEKYKVRSYNLWKTMTTLPNHILAEPNQISILHTVNIDVTCATNRTANVQGLEPVWLWPN